MQEWLAFFRSLPLSCADYPGGASSANITPIRKLFLKVEPQRNSSHCDVAGMAFCFFFNVIALYHLPSKRNARRGARASRVYLLDADYYPHLLGYRRVMLCTCILLPLHPLDVPTQSKIFRRYVLGVILGVHRSFVMAGCEVIWVGVGPCRVQLDL